MSQYPTINNVQVGDELPVMRKSASEAELFLYSAASFNPHRIHYDRSYAEYEGHEDIVVHGPLQGSWLTQFITDWAGPQARLVSVSGVVSSIVETNGSVQIEIEERKNDGSLLMPARATVRLGGS